MTTPRCLKVNFDNKRVLSESFSLVASFREANSADLITFLCKRCWQTPTGAWAANHNTLFGRHRRWKKIFGFSVFLYKEQRECEEQETLLLG
jgi:hypothetical protein